MNRKGLYLVFSLLCAFAIGACTSNPSSKEGIVKLQSQAAQLSDSLLAQNYYARSDRNGQYLLGGSDVLEIKVLGAEELNRVIRISADGSISFPLIGDVRLSGLSISEAEYLIASRLGQNYLQSPQVSVYVTEYGANQVTLTGEVRQPDVYSLTQSRSLVEMIAIAGGLTERAGDTLRLNTTQYDPQSREPRELVLLLNINDLLSSDGGKNFVLSAGDSIYVPKAGEVFIEGEVKRPGSYPITPELTLRKAMVLAGGINWEANKSNIGIIREGFNEPVVINYKEIEDDKAQDISIQKGDLIIVDYSVAKRTISTIFKGIGRVVNVGVEYRPLD